MTDNKHLPAYPDPRRGAPQSFTNQYPEDEPMGLTKREKIASMCLQGLMSGVNPDDVTFTSLDNAIDCAVQAADKLLSHLSNNQP